MPVRGISTSASGLSAALFPRADGSIFAEISVNATAWTELTSGFSNMISIAIQNKTDTQIKVRGNDPGGGVYKGMVLDPEDERSYNDIKDGFTVWARTQSGTKILNVEALTSA